jgi:phosphatidyl-myo-inositol alpha-mannosyltransferase
MSGSMRVALVTEHYYPHPGGVSEHVFHLARHLSGRGHEVAIVTGAGAQASDVPLPERVRFIPIGAGHVRVGANGAISQLTVGVGLGRQVRQALAGFDVVHVHAPLWPVLPLVAVKQAPREAALVGTLHSVFQPSLAVRLARPYLQSCLDTLDAVVSVDENVHAVHARVGLRYAGEIVPNGIDAAYWRQGRRLPALDDGRVNVLTLARFDSRARLDVAIHAFALAHSQHPALRLVMVGDGPQRAALEAAVPGPLRAHVSFVGQRIADRNDYAASAQIFCFTHALASQSMSLLEAMAAGLPIVYPEADFTRRVLVDGEDGLCVPAADVEAYAAAIVRLARDAALRSRLGESACRRASGYAWPTIGARVEEVYRQALAGRRCLAAG